MNKNASKLLDTAVNRMPSPTMKTRTSWAVGCVTLGHMINFALSCIDDVVAILALG